MLEYLISERKREIPLPPMGCDWKKCRAYDHYDRLWEASPGSLATHPCPSSDGIATWECLPNGQFSDEGINLQQCSNKWIPELSDDVEKVSYAFIKGIFSNNMRTP